VEQADANAASLATLLHVEVQDTQRINFGVFTCVGLQQRRSMGKVNWCQSPQQPQKPQQPKQRQQQNLCQPWREQQRTRVTHHVEQVLGPNFDETRPALAVLPQVQAVVAGAQLVPCRDR